jgi:hypothetical protein
MASELMLRQVLVYNVFLGHQTMEEVCKLGRPTLLCSMEAVSLCVWITTKFM